VQFTHHLAETAANTLGYKRSGIPSADPELALTRTWQASLRGKPLAKYEMHPGVVSTPRGITLRWRAGSITFYIDFYSCRNLENVDYNDCMVVDGVHVIGEINMDEMYRVLDSWQVPRITGAFRAKMHWYQNNPEFLEKIPGRKQGRVHASQTEV
jgi:hypothetical protein